MSLMSADGGFSSYRDSKANNEIKFTKANPGVINSLKELLFRKRRNICICKRRA